MLGESMTANLELTSAIPPPLPLYRFSLEQYQRLGAIGVLTPEDRVELLEGWIVEKMNQGPMHGYLVGLLSEWFQRRIPAGFVVRCQLPVTFQRSEPEPDLVIVKGVHHDFRDRHPFGQDCRLVIEVADTSIDRDRAKAAIYREAGVEEYWIVNVSDQFVEQYRFVDPMHSAQPSILPTDTKVAIRLSDTELVLDLGLLFD